MPSDTVALIVACVDNVVFVWICVWVQWSRMPSHAASIASYLMKHRLLFNCLRLVKPFLMHDLRWCETASDLIVLRA